MVIVSMFSELGGRSCIPIGFFLGGEGKAVERRTDRNSDVTT